MHQPPAESTRVRQRQHLEHDNAAIWQSGYRYALSMLRLEVDAEEAVQEAFCRLQNQARDVCGSIDAALLDWNLEENRATFFATLRNYCIDLIRRRTVRKEIPLLDQDRASKNNLLQDDAAEMIAAIDLLINQLPENWADVLRLKVNAGLSYDEIAEITGCTRNQVRTWIYRARRQLEHGLARQGYAFASRSYEREKVQ